MKTGPVNRIAFVCHQTRSAVPATLRQIVDWADQNGVEILLDHHDAKRIDTPQLGHDQSELAANAQIVVVLGGDGTILDAVRHFSPYGLPVAGINLGHLGFLTVGAGERAIPILERIRAGRFKVENRMMLKATVLRGEETMLTKIALNDVVVVKQPVDRVIGVKVSISGTLINSFRGDGIICSTPTGSTAYSLSAGGPIVPPWVNAMIVCPLNSHTLTARPVVISDHEILQAIIHCSNSQADLVFDGQEGFNLVDGDRIEVSKADEPAKIVVFKTRNFFQVLRKKMNWG